MSRTAGPRTAAGPFKRVYTPAEIRLLAEAGEIGGQLCGPAACEVLRRQ